MTPILMGGERVEGNVVLNTALCNSFHLPKNKYYPHCLCIPARLGMCLFFRLKTDKKKKKKLSEILLEVLEFKLNVLSFLLLRWICLRGTIDSKIGDLIDHKKL